ncbi:unnamed protein product [Phaedon cochleariae]|uniref:Uncharacterized protein n=1 Tax=Phaedon cochleariae TaxID=80249 RepID=A0A9N9SCA1_PHACE|nr:unnamed protein product [Phaedon cochleariae]
MASNIIVIVASLFVIQCAYSQSIQDPRIQACAKKIWDQVEQLQYGKVPLCYDLEKLKEVTKETGVFLEFNSEIPDKCKTLSTENVAECFEIVSNMISNKSDDLKTSILNSIKGVHIHSFADDSTLHTVFSSRAPILARQIRNERGRNVDNINMHLATILDWGFNNLVDFNANKTQACLFSRKGITISNNLFWENHELFHVQSDAYDLEGTDTTCPGILSPYLECSTQTYPETVGFGPKKGNSSRG